MRPKQQALALPLAGTVADVRDRLAAQNPSWGNRPIYTCYCCGEKYRKGEWECCAAPTGMGHAAWLEQWHANCPHPIEPVGPGLYRCPRHCGCQPDPLEPLRED
jgi:hypothetical protein